MKNNQFRAHITKYLKVFNKLITITVDIDSNTRKVYLYEENGNCLGSLSLYFTNEYVNIAYSKNNDRVCKLSNQADEERFDYCELRAALIYINRAIDYFCYKTKGGTYAKSKLG